MHFLLDSFLLGVLQSYLASHGRVAASLLRVELLELIVNSLFISSFSWCYSLRDAVNCSGYLVWHICQYVKICPSMVFHSSCFKPFLRFFLLVPFSPHLHILLSLSLLSGLSFLSSHVSQGHLWADREGVPLQVHLHIGSGPEPVPLRQRDGWDWLWATSTGPPVAAHRGDTRTLVLSGWQSKIFFSKLDLVVHCWSSASLSSWKMSRSL